MSSSIFCRRGALGCSRAHFNSRTPCGVRRRPLLFCHVSVVISIHAPLAGCDRDTEQLLIVAVNISIHAPLTGCDVTGVRRTKPPPNFNPRTPCGVRRIQGAQPGIVAVFQSTHPSRGVTLLHQIVDTPHAISIHAPLAGCDDNSRTAHCLPPRHFNPRTPRGVRLP